MNSNFRRNFIKGFFSLLFAFISCTAFGQTISGPNSACSGDPLFFTADDHSGQRLQWFVSGDGINWTKDKVMDGNTFTYDKMPNNDLHVGYAIYTATVAAPTVKHTVTRNTTGCEEAICNTTYSGDYFFGTDFNPSSGTSYPEGTTFTNVSQLESSFKENIETKPMSQQNNLGSGTLEDAQAYGYHMDGGTKYAFTHELPGGADNQYLYVRDNNVYAEQINFNSPEYINVPFALTQRYYLEWNSRGEWDGQASAMVDKTAGALGFKFEGDYGQMCNDILMSINVYEVTKDESGDKPQWIYTPVDMSQPIIEINRDWQGNIISENSIPRVEINEGTLEYDGYTFMASQAMQPRLTIKRGGLDVHKLYCVDVTISGAFTHNNNKNIKLKLESPNGNGWHTAVDYISFVHRSVCVSPRKACAGENILVNTAGFKYGSTYVWEQWDQTSSSYVPITNTTYPDASQKQALIKLMSPGVHKYRVYSPKDVEDYNKLSADDKQKTPSPYVEFTLIGEACDEIACATAPDSTLCLGTDNLSAIFNVQDKEVLMGEHTFDWELYDPNKTKVQTVTNSESATITFNTSAGLSEEDFLKAGVAQPYKLVLIANKDGLKVCTDTADVYLRRHPSSLGLALTGVSEYCPATANTPSAQDTIKLTGTTGKLSNYTTSWLYATESTSNPLEAQLAINTTGICLQKENITAKYYVDNAGCKDSVEISIPVNQTLPDITCPTEAAPLALPATSAVYTYTLPAPASVSVGCGPATVTITTTINGTSYTKKVGETIDLPAGTHTLTYTVTDGCGRSLGCPMLVTVEDVTPPNLDCNITPITESVTSGCEYTFTSIASPKLTDLNGVDGEITGTFVGRSTDPAADKDPSQYTKDEFEMAFTRPYPVGTTYILWAFADNAGNTSYCRQTVTITDNRDLEVTCPDNSDTYIIPSCKGPTGEEKRKVGYVLSQLETLKPTVEYISCTTSETVTLTPTVTIKKNFGPVGEQVFRAYADNEKLDYSDATGPSSTHTYTIKWTYTKEGAFIEEKVVDCTLDIVLRDTTAPTMLCYEDITVQANNDQNYCFPKITQGGGPWAQKITDPAIEDVSHFASGVNPGFTSKPGEDKWGNGGCQWDVNNITFSLAGKLKLPSATDMEDDCGGKVKLTVTITGPTSYNNATPSTETILNNREYNATEWADALKAMNEHKFYYLQSENAGTHTITYTLKDEAGNEYKCEQRIKVVAEFKPVVSCPDPFTPIELNADFSSCVASHEINTTDVPTAEMPYWVTTKEQWVNNCENMHQSWDDMSNILSMKENTKTGYPYRLDIYKGVDAESLTGGVHTFINNGPDINGADYWKIAVSRGDTVITKIESVAQCENTWVPGWGGGSWQMRPNGKSDLYTVDNGTSHALTSVILRHNYFTQEQLTSAFSNLPIGTHKYVWHFKNNIGQEDSCVWKVTVEDQNAPIVECQEKEDVIVKTVNKGHADYETYAKNCLGKYTIKDKPDVEEHCSKPVSYFYVLDGGKTAADTVAFTEESKDIALTIGNHHFAWIVKDSRGNVDSCSFKIIVKDDTKPEYKCPEDQTLLSAEECKVTYTFSAEQFEASDLCSNDNLLEYYYTIKQNGVVYNGKEHVRFSFPITETVPVENVDLEVSDITYTFLWFVKDANGVEDTCQSSVTVKDASKFEIECPEITSDTIESCTDLTWATIEPTLETRGLIANDKYYDCVQKEEVSASHKTYYKKTTEGEGAFTELTSGSVFTFQTGYNIRWIYTKEASYIETKKDTCELELFIGDTTAATFDCSKVDDVTLNVVNRCDTTYTIVRPSDEAIQDNCTTDFDKFHFFYKLNGGAEKQWSASSKETLNVGETYTLTWRIEDAVGNVTVKEPACPQNIIVNDHRKFEATCATQEALSIDGCGAMTWNEVANKMTAENKPTATFTSCKPATITPTVQTAIYYKVTEDADDTYQSVYTEGTSFAYKTNYTLMWVFTLTGDHIVESHDTCYTTVFIQDVSNPVADCSKMPALEDVFIKSATACDTTIAITAPTAVFSDNCSIKNINFKWKFNDGVSSDPIVYGETTKELTFKPGNYTITWWAEDQEGLTSATCDQTLSVRDSALFELSCPEKGDDKIYDVQTCEAPSGVVLLDSLTNASYKPTAEFKKNCVGLTRPTITETVYIQKDGESSWDLLKDVASLELKSEYTIKWMFSVEQTATTAKMTDSCVYQIRIGDVTEPTFTCPAEAVAQTPDNATDCNALVSIDLSKFNPSDNCEKSPADFKYGYYVNGLSTDTTYVLYSASPVTISLPVSATPYTIAWVVEDKAGNRSECEQTVTAKDETNPTITCPSDTIIQLLTECTDDYHFPKATITDNCTENVDAYYSFDGTDFTKYEVGASKVLAAGDYTIYWYGIDEAGKQSETCSAAIIVKDSIGLVKHCPTEEDVTIVTCKDMKWGDIYTQYADSQKATVAQMNCAENKTVYIEPTLSYQLHVDGADPKKGTYSDLTDATTFTYGETYDIRWLFIKTGDNVSDMKDTCYSTVTLKDTANPTVNCEALEKSITLYVKDKCDTLYAITEPVGVFDDNCGDENLTYFYKLDTKEPKFITGSNSETLKPGVHTLVWWVLDDEDNKSATCSQTITVIDSTEFDLVCPTLKNVTIDTCVNLTWAKIKELDLFPEEAKAEGYIIGDCSKPIGQQWIEIEPTLYYKTASDEYAELTDATEFAYNTTYDIKWLFTKGGNDGDFMAKMDTACFTTLLLKDISVPTVDCSKMQDITLKPKSGCDTTYILKAPEGVFSDKCGDSGLNFWFKTNDMADYEEFVAGTSNITIKVGDTIVSWLVKDEFNTSAACPQTITVLDSSLFKTTCPEEPSVTINTCEDMKWKDIKTELTDAQKATAKRQDCASSDSIAIDPQLFYEKDGNYEALTDDVTFTYGETYNIKWLFSKGGNAGDFMAKVDTACFTTITLQDTANPTVTCSAMAAITLEPKNACDTLYKILKPTDVFNDNCGEANLTYYYKVDGAADYTEFDGNNKETLDNGEHTLTWMVKDQKENESETCDQAITVTDTKKPEIVCPKDTTIQLLTTCTDVYKFPRANATDNCTDTDKMEYYYKFNGDADFTLYAADASKELAAGNYTITWYAKDSTGNESTTCTAGITVKDSIGLVKKCPKEEDVTIVTCEDMKWEDIYEQYADSQKAVVSQMNCAEDKTEYIEPTLSYQLHVDGADPKEGTYTELTSATTLTYNKTYDIRWLFVKTGENVSDMKDTCYSTVTLKDTVNPTVDCSKMKEITLQPKNSCDTLYTIIKPEGVFNDNCLESNLTYYYKLDDNADFTKFTGTNAETLHVGVHTLAWKVADEFNESENCDQTINVLDSTKILIECPSALSVTINTCVDMTWAEVEALLADSQKAVANRINCEGTEPIHLDSIMYFKKHEDETFAALSSVTTFTYNTLYDLKWLFVKEGENIATMKDSCLSTVLLKDTADPKVDCSKMEDITLKPKNTCDTLYTMIKPAGVFSDECSDADLKYYYNLDENGFILFEDNQENLTNGVHTVIWKVADEFNESKTCDQTITVLDSTKIDKHCPTQEDVTINTCENMTWADIKAKFAANQTATAKRIDCASSDSVAIEPQMFFKKESDDDFAPLTDAAEFTYDEKYNILWVFEKSGENIAAMLDTCESTVTLQDTANPTVTCSAMAAISLEPKNACDTLYKILKPTDVFDDNCGEANLTYYYKVDGAADYTEFDGNNQETLDNGEHTLTWMVKDQKENESKTCDQIITVTDTKKPEVVCPNDTTIQLLTTCTDVYKFPRANATDNCTDTDKMEYYYQFNGDADFTLYVADASKELAAGNYTITWYAKDSTGNESATCTAAITVKDSIGLVKSCPKEEDVTIVTCEDMKWGDIYEQYADSQKAVVSQMNCAEDKTEYIEPTLYYQLHVDGAEPKDGTYTALTNTTTLTYGETYDIRWLFVKTGDNVSDMKDTCYSTVTLKDTANPTVDCEALEKSITLYVKDKCDTLYAITEPEGVFDDNCGEENLTYFYKLDTNEPKFITGSNSETLKPGVHTLVWWVLDDEDNKSATCSQTITVIDSTEFDLVCPTLKNVTIDTCVNLTWAKIKELDLFPEEAKAEGYIIGDCSKPIGQQWIEIEPTLYYKTASDEYAELTDATEFAYNTTYDIKWLFTKGGNDGDFMAKMDTACFTTLLLKDISVPTVDCSKMENVTLKPKSGCDTTYILKAPEGVFSDKCGDSGLNFWFKTNDMADYEEFVAGTSNITIKVGDTIVSWLVKDELLNTSDACPQTITVLDSSLFKTTCPEESSVTINTCEDMKWEDIKAELTDAQKATAKRQDCASSDSIAIDPQLFYEKDGNYEALADGVTFTYGETYNIKWLFSKGGNAGDFMVKVDTACFTTITLQDTANPTVTCGNMPAITLEPQNTCDTLYKILKPTDVFDDNCGEANLTYYYKVDGAADYTEFDGSNQETLDNGEHTLTWMVKDQKENESETCDQAITVTDTKKPEVVCPKDTTIQLLTTCTDVYKFPRANATDNCTDTDKMEYYYQFNGDADFTLYVADASKELVAGNYTITWYAQDSTGNMSTTCTAGITVKDSIGLIKSCPKEEDVTIVTCEDMKWGDIFTQYADSQKAVVSQMNCAEGKNDSITPTLSYQLHVDGADPKDGTYEALSNTTTLVYNKTYDIRWLFVKTGENVSDMSDTCYSTVTLKDTVNPTVDCSKMEDITLQPKNTCDTIYTIIKPEGVFDDNCQESNLTYYYKLDEAEFVQFISNGDTTSTETLYKGVHSFIWKVKDEFNESESCTQTITVLDSTAFDIQCPTLADVTIDTCATMTWAEIFDKLSDDQKAHVQRYDCDTKDSIDVDPIMFFKKKTDEEFSAMDNDAVLEYNTTYDIKWLYVKEGENIATMKDSCLSTVLLKDISVPTVICENLEDITLKPTACDTLYSIIKPEGVFDDNCKEENLTYYYKMDDNEEFTIFDGTNQENLHIGIHSFIWKVKDQFNESESCPQTVTVLDSTGFKKFCPDQDSVTIDTCAAMTWAEIFAKYDASQKALVKRIDCANDIEEEVDPIFSYKKSTDEEFTTLDNETVLDYNTLYDIQWLFVKEGEGFATMTDTCFSTVLLKDTSVPTVDCSKLEDITLQPKNTCDTLYTIIKPEGVFDDNCEESNLAYFYKLDENEFVQFISNGDTTSTETLYKGVHSFIWKVKDEFNESESCTQTITVLDSTAFDIQCPTLADVTIDTCSTMTWAEIFDKLSDDQKAHVQRYDCDTKDSIDVDPIMFFKKETDEEFAAMDNDAVLEYNTNYDIKWLYVKEGENIATMKDSCLSTVLLKDISVPTVICENLEDITLKPTACDTLYSIIKPEGVFDDNCKEENLTYYYKMDDNEEFTVFDGTNQENLHIGVHSFIWKVKDQFNESESCPQTVTVLDSTGFKKFCPDQDSVTIDTCAAMTWAEIFAKYDASQKALVKRTDCANDIEEEVAPIFSYKKSTDEEFAALDNETVLDYNTLYDIQWLFVKEGEGFATMTDTCFSTVLLKDTSVPTVDCSKLEDITLQPKNTCDTLYTIIKPEGVFDDVCGEGNLTYYYKLDEAEFVPFISNGDTTSTETLYKGVHTFIWKVKDEFNESDTCHQTITVLDSTAFDIQCPTLADVTIDTCSTMTWAEIFGKLSDDQKAHVQRYDCDIKDSVVVDPIMYFKKETETEFVTMNDDDILDYNTTYDIMWLYVKEGENIATMTDTCFSTVLLKDTSVPTVICENLEDITLKPTACDTLYSIIKPEGVFDDNCKEENLTYYYKMDDNEEFTVFDGTNQENLHIGVHSFIWKVKDQFNESESCPQTVTVLDSTGFNKTCPDQDSVTIDTCAAMTWAEIFAKYDASQKALVKRIDCANDIEEEVDPIFSYKKSTDEEFAALDNETVLDYNTLYDIQWLFVKEGEGFATMTDTCFSTVLLKDTANPTVDCSKMEDITLQPATSCDTLYKLIKPEGVFDDNCQESNLTYFYKYGEDDFVEFIAGTSEITVENGDTIVTWKVKDEFNESATCDQKITVIDTVKPVTTCPNDTIIRVMADCETAVALNPATAADSCGIDGIQYSNDNITFLPFEGTTLDTTLAVGEHTIYWRSVDIHGNISDVCSTSITIKDTIRPEVTCPEAISQSLKNSCDVDITFTPATATDNCTVKDIFYSFDNVAFEKVTEEPIVKNYMVGKDTVYWYAEDIYGNVSDTCAQSIEILDERQFDLDCPTFDGEGSFIVETCGDLKWEALKDSLDKLNMSASASYTDCNTNETTPVDSVAMEYSVKDSEVWDKMDNDTKLFYNQDYIIRWIFTKTGENITNVSDTCELPVVLRDTTKPVFDCDNIDPDSMVQVVAACEVPFSEINFNKYTATDNCDVNIDGILSWSEDINDTVKVNEPFEVGKLYELKWIFRDKMGNQVTCDQKVMLNSDKAPLFDCDSLKGAPIEKVLEGVCEITAEDLNVNTPFALDACTKDTLWGVGRRTSGKAMTDIYEVGRDTIVWSFSSIYSTATDSCEQYVFIQSDLKPVFDCEEIHDTTIYLSLTECELDGNKLKLPIPYAKDACTKDSVEGVPSREDGKEMTDPFERGVTTTVIWTFTSEYSTASHTCKQNVTVLDTLAPVLACETLSDTVAVSITDSSMYDEKITYAEILMQVPEFVAPTVEDACDGTITATATRNDGLAFEDTYPLGITHITWTYTDKFGNSDTCHQVVFVEDYTIDTLFCPTNWNHKTVTCIDTFPIYGSFEEFVAAGGSFSNPKKLKENSFYVTEDFEGRQYCDESYYRTYHVLDKRNNDIFCTDTVYVKDNIAPSFNSTLEPEKVISCADDVPEVLIVNATDNCDPEPKVTLDESNTRGTDPSKCDYYTYEIVRKFTAIDRCDNSVDMIQKINITDTIGPKFNRPDNWKDTVLASNLKACEFGVPDLTIGMSEWIKDDCTDNTGITITQNPTAGSHIQQTTTVWIVMTDLCNNNDSISKVVRVQDISNIVKLDAFEIDTCVSTELPFSIASQTARYANGRVEIVRPNGMVQNVGAQFSYDYYKGKVVSDSFLVFSDNPVTHREIINYYKQQTGGVDEMRKKLTSFSRNSQSGYYTYVAMDTITGCADTATAYVDLNEVPRISMESGLESVCELNILDSARINSYIQCINPMGREITSSGWLNADTLFQFYKDTIHVENDKTSMVFYATNSCGTTTSLNTLIEFCGSEPQTFEDSLYFVDDDLDLYNLLKADEFRTRDSVLLDVHKRYDPSNIKITTEPHDPARIWLGELVELTVHTDYSYSGLNWYRVVGEYDRRYMRDSIEHEEFIFQPDSIDEEDYLIGFDRYGDNPVLTDMPEDTARYYVTISDGVCPSVASDVVQVNVILKIPTAFTPYVKDGMNDVFMERHTISIFDRYGMKVFEGDNGWDGTKGGKMADPGVYFYVVVMTDGSLRKGTIELVFLDN